MSGNATLKHFKTMLAEAKLPERTVPICLRGDLVAEHEEAERQLEQATQVAADSLAGSGAGDLADHIRGLEAEMRDHAVTFTLRALPRASWRALLNDHPPRRDDAGEILAADAGMDLNVETFYVDLVRRSVVHPELDDADWDALFGVITDRQFGDLAGAAWLLNRGEIDVPFSRAASLTKRLSAAG